jgi:hypothetical protein
MLCDALQDEKKKITYYETMLTECDDPAMQKFVNEVMELHKTLVGRITEKLNVIRANAEVLDGIITSFEG